MGNVLYLQYPGLPEPSGWGGIILPGHFTLLSRAVTFMDGRNLTGQGSRAGFAAVPALGAARLRRMPLLRERGKVVLINTIEELFANSLSL